MKHYKVPLGNNVPDLFCPIRKSFAVPSYVFSQAVNSSQFGTIREEMANEIRRV